MHLYIPWLLLSIPVLPAIAGMLARHLSAASAARLSIAAAAASLVIAAAACVGLAMGGPLTARWMPLGADSSFSLSLRLDVVSAVMVLLVSFLGFIVVRFSKNYLAGDPHQARFCSWMALTLASVLTLVLSGNLLLILATWITTSLSLHRLLLHYPDRAGAIFSARKKFVVSRLGDLSLAIALLLVYRHYGTWDLETLFATIQNGDTAGLPLTCVFLAACAALKSAQFPFHSWLPDTMETPTPVSAFMHAGIINAGGFLIVRLSPLFVHAPGALATLAILGTLTAAFGAIVMLAQPGVKRALAYSTIAQMGFMILQCGLGAFGLALLHIVAHSLYKAHAFLHAGSTIGAVPRAAVPLKTPALLLGLLAGAALVAGGAFAIAALAPSSEIHLGVFALVFAFALAYGLARAWSAGGTKRTAILGAGVATAIVLIGLVLHAGSTAFFAHLPNVTPSPFAVGFATVTFTALFFFQALLWRAGHHALGRRLYVHALNGFYVGTYANRLLGWLWPRHQIG